MKTRPTKSTYQKIVSIFSLLILKNSLLRLPLVKWRFRNADSPANPSKKFQQHSAKTQLVFIFRNHLMTHLIHHVLI